MQIDKILDEWKTDSVLNEHKLDSESIRFACLHSKYLEWYSIAKLKLKQKELEGAKLSKDLWLYYNGKMSKAEMDERGFEYDPFNGLAKPIKSDMHYFLDTDEKIQKNKMQVETLKVTVDALKEILDSIKWKHQTIRNILSHKQFMAGG